MLTSPSLSGPNFKSSPDLLCFEWPLSLPAPWISPVPELWAGSGDVTNHSPANSGACGQELGGTLWSALPALQSFLPPRSPQAEGTDGWRVKRCREMAEEGPEPGGVPIYRRRQDSGWRDLRANFPQGNYNLLLTSRDKLAYQVGSVCVCRCTCTYDEAPWVRGSGPCREAGPWHSGSAHAKGWLILQLLVPQLHELG